MKQYTPLTSEQCLELAKLVEHACDCSKDGTVTLTVEVAGHLAERLRTLLSIEQALDVLQSRNGK